jgi:hypothetical protein
MSSPGFTRTSAYPPRKIAESPGADAPRFGAGHSLALEVLGPHGNVHLQLFPDFARDDVAADECAESGEPGANHSSQLLMTASTARSAGPSFSARQ